MTTLRETITDIWDSLTGRVMLCGAAIGWVPFYLLSLATAQLCGAA